jgi:hypothetical protein
MGNASDSEAGGYARLPADDSEAGDVGVAMPCSCCSFFWCPHICELRCGAEGIVEARFRVFCPTAVSGCDPSRRGVCKDLGLLGPRMRRSAAYAQTSPRVRQRWQLGCSPEHLFEKTRKHSHYRCI